MAKPVILAVDDDPEVLAAVRRELQAGWGNCTAQLFSSLKKQGVEEAEGVIGAWLYPPEDQVPDAVAEV